LSEKLKEIDCGEKCHEGYGKVSPSLLKWLIISQGGRKKIESAV
jgi:hypothetical protein